MEHHKKKKKKRSKGSKNGRVGKAVPSSSQGDVKQGKKVVGSLLEASSSVSANEDPKKDGEVIVGLDEISEDGSTTLSSCVSSSETCMEDHCLQNGARQKCKMKKDIASAGTVSTLLGKDYVMSVPKKISSRMKGSNGEFFSREDAEQFLCSMFGEHCELSFSALRDVLSQCGYDVNKHPHVIHWKRVAAA